MNIETETYGGILSNWNPDIHNDLQEMLRIWEILRGIKDYGTGEVRFIIRGGIIVSAETEKKWVRKGGDFSTSNL